MREKFYFLGRDNDTHWYLVEDAHRVEWFAWLNLDEYDEASWDVPDWAERINDPSQIAFLHPVRLK